MIDVPDFLRLGDALCAETDPDGFFPDKGESNRTAKKVCAGCELRLPCADWAITNGEPFGVWGGLSERERRRIRRRTFVGPRPINHGTRGGYLTHLRRGENACDDCLRANREKSSALRKGRAA